MSLVYSMRAIDPPQPPAMQNGGFFGQHLVLTRAECHSLHHALPPRVALHAEEDAAVGALPEFLDHLVSLRRHGARVAAPLAPLQVFHVGSVGSLDVQRDEKKASFLKFMYLVHTVMLRFHS